MRTIKERLLFFLRLPEGQDPEARENEVLQFLGDKSVVRIKSCVPCSLRTIQRWTSRFGRGGLEHLRERQRTGRPRRGPGRPGAGLRLVGGGQAPAQDPGEGAGWTAQRVRRAWGEKCGSVLRSSPVRRLPLAPQRSPGCVAPCELAAGQRGQAPESPSSCAGSKSGEPCLGRRVRSGCAERGRAAWGPPRAGLRRAGGQRALAPEPAGGRQPGGPARGQGAGRPCSGGGLPGVPGADRGGSGPEDAAGGRQLQDAPRTDQPGAAGGEPSRGRAVFSAGLVAGEQCGGTARGLGPAARPARAEPDRSPAARQPGSCWPVLAGSSGTGAGLLARGGPPACFGLHSEGPTGDASRREASRRGRLGRAVLCRICSGSRRWSRTPRGRPCAGEGQGLRRPAPPLGRADAPSGVEFSRETRHGVACEAENA